MTMMLMKTWSRWISKDQLLKKILIAPFFHFTKSNPRPKMKENISNRKMSKCQNIILILFAQCTSLWNWFLHSNYQKSPTLLLKIFFSKSRSFNWTQTKRVLSPISYAVSRAYTKISYKFFCSFFHVL